MLDDMYYPTKKYTMIALHHDLRILKYKGANGIL